MTRSRVWWWVGVSWLGWVAGCLGGPALEAAPGDEELTGLTVHDSQGAPWPGDAAPRSPALVVQFDRPPTRVDTRLWLVRGGATPDLLEDLGDPPLRTATQHALVPLELAAEGSVVRARPALPLEPGTRYTLVWTRGELEAQLLPLGVSRSAAAGAQLVESWPGDRDVRVPPNLARLFLRFDGYVRGLDGALISLARDGTRVPLALTVLACVDLGLPDGDCLELTPGEPLAAGATYQLDLADGLRDATGAPLGPRTLHFSTRAAPDDQPPLTLETRCAPDERMVPAGCLLPTRDGFVLRGSVDEPALVSLSAGGLASAALALAGHFELPLHGLTGSPLAARLAAVDLVGHTSEHTFEAESAYALASLAIDELRPDPLGPEPAQEFVELFNFGAESVQIMGFSLTDDPLATGRTVLTPLAVEPGERVLVVGPEFEPRDLADGALPPGVRLARLDGGLSLRNDGEALLLRDELGRRVTSTLRRAPEQPGQCLGHLEGDPEGVLVPDPQGGCTPGTATREATR